ncbi:hypothetical protein [Actinopolymorpha pittospori]|uniref:Uncharacterized protein n=1 Tax=Actinopolymorpha pittospori TaxID=648752 RepID=A0A927MWT6_9ACTN|nr:hypothetical protein [Actinopolymorpha pittospori]MBE1604690.1 hypothetical protein [Actinopolymorpha pittospori]
MLPSQAEQLVADGTPRPAAGMYLAGWYAGTAAEFVGLSLLGSGAGYLLAPVSTRWWRNPDGYADALDFADVTRVVVLPDHPWSGQPDTHTVTTRAEQAEFVVTALVETVAPAIDALQRLTRAGRAGLWHQVADAIGAALVDQDAVPATPEAVDLLRGLLAADARPWKRPPRVEVLATGGGPVWVTHRGGCCMAFTEPAADDLDLDDYDAAFQQAFPRTDGRPDYCLTCKFRPFAESVRMQLWRRERLANERSAQAG